MQNLGSIVTEWKNIKFGTQFAYTLPNDITRGAHINLGSRIYTVARFASALDELSTQSGYLRDAHPIWLLSAPTSDTCVREGTSFITCSNVVQIPAWCTALVHAADIHPEIHKEIV